jgi:hypothetical protein
MIELSLENIQNLLKEKKYDVKLQKETDQLFVILKNDRGEFPLFIRIYEGGDLLQLLLFIPSQFQPGVEPHLARLLHTLNKEIDIPGFGVDEGAKVIFYRCMIPAFNKYLEEGIIEQYLKSLPLIAGSFAPIITTVANGQVTYEEVMKKMKEFQSKK